MQITDLAHLRTPGEPTLSPDGRHAVVAVSRLDLDDDAYRSDLWLVTTDGSRPPRQLTYGPRDALPRYSPDGRWIAFLRSQDKDKPQLHVMPADGGEPRQVSDHPLGADSPTWSPDSTRIAYIARVPEDGRYGTDEDVPPEKEPPRRITTLKYRLDNVGFTIDRRQHVFVVDALDPDTEPVQLTDGDADDIEPAWSPDGEAVVFVSARHAERDTDIVSDLYTVPSAGGDPVRVTPTFSPVSRPAFSPDGKDLLFCAHGHPNPVARNTGVWTIPADGSAAPERLTDAERWDTSNPLGSGSDPLLVDDDTVVTIALDRGGVRLMAIPRRGGEPETVVGGQRQVQGYARAGETLVVTAATATSAGELVAVSGDGETVLTDFGAELSRTASLRPMTEVHTEAPDGYPVHGWVLRPAGTGPFPVLLTVHGGPFSQYGWTLFDEAQVYAGAGYAVVMGNPRGSSGYGEAHGQAIVHQMGDRDTADLMALLDSALEDPDLDSGRVGVMGGSYGGWMTTWLLAKTDRFTAGISERAVNAFDSFTGSSDIGWFFTDAYAGTDPEAVTAQSPLTYADDIAAPTLIIHSEHDWRCPVEQAQRLYVRLKRRDVDTELLLFPGEGHELSRSGLPSHRVARFEAILNWWGRHLQ